MQTIPDCKRKFSMPHREDGASLRHTEKWADWFCVLFSYSPSVHIWDESFNLQQSYIGHTGAVNAVQPYPHGPLILTASQDETIRVWNLLNGTEVDRWGVAGAIVDSAVSAPTSVTIWMSLDVQASPTKLDMQGPPANQINYCVPRLQAACTCIGDKCAINSPLLFITYT